MKINKVLFTNNSLKSIKKIISIHKLKTEIGGSLVGYQQGNRLIITHASDSGNNSILAYNSIELDGEYVTEFCNRLNVLSNYKLYFLGDWHTHLSDNLNPSLQDLIAMKRLWKYMPKKYRYTLITVIVNHYNPLKFRVYTLTEDSKFELISHSIISDPSWIIKYM